MRNIFFDTGFYKVKQVDAKVISIGNLTLGGSGKTPMVVFITKLLKQNGLKPGILSRGYRRKTSGYLLVNDGNSFLASVEECGDEIYLASMECETPAAVSEKRVEGAAQFIKDTNIESIVLDDAYQHRWIHRDLDILMFDQRFLSKLNKIEQNLLPSGEMREPFDSIKRADLVVLNRKFSHKKDIPERLNKYFAGKNIFEAHYQTAGIVDVKNHRIYTIEEFTGQKSLVVCGIARPFSFIRIMEKSNIDVSNKLIFPDHKFYSEKEVNKIRKAFYDTNSYSVLTTQKDAVKLNKYAKELDDIDIYYVKIEICFDEREKLEKTILEKIN